MSRRIGCSGCQVFHFPADRPLSRARQVVGYDMIGSEAERPLQTEGSRSASHPVRTSRETRSAKFQPPSRSRRWRPSDPGCVEAPPHLEIRHPASPGREPRCAWVHGAPAQAGVAGIQGMKRARIGPQGCRRAFPSAPNEGPCQGILGRPHRDEGSGIPGPEGFGRAGEGGDGDAHGRHIGPPSAATDNPRRGVGIRTS